jgi:hypothetical protein
MLLWNPRSFRYLARSQGARHLPFEGVKPHLGQWNSVLINGAMSNFPKNMATILKKSFTFKR